MIEKILKETRRVQRYRIGIALTILAEFCYPIDWLSRIEHVEQGGIIKIRFA